MATIRELFSKVLSDCLTSTTGDYDPARVFGYGVVVLGALEFLVLSAYSTIKEGKFDMIQFSTGLAAIGGALMLAAGGVWIKKTAENIVAEAKKET